MSQDGAPKSAYELAMERLRKKDEAAGIVQAPLTDAQKAAIADIRSLYGAKLAQADLQHQDRLRATFDPAVREALEVPRHRIRHGEYAERVDDAQLSFDDLLLLDSAQ